MSAIFYHDDEQHNLAKSSMEAMKNKMSKQIRTEILPFDKFWDAEMYHQKYLLQRHAFLLTALEIEPDQQLIDSHVAARVNGFVGGYGKIQDFDQEWEKLGLTEKMADYVKTQLTKNFRGSS